MQSSRHPAPGQVVILNGVPRSGKTSIARALQERADEPWLHLGVDAAADWLPEGLRPGAGLRPGGESPELEGAVVLLYRALFDAVAAHVRLGLNVVVDLGLHESYSRPLPIVGDGARRLVGHPVLFVGVHCASDVIWQRRAETWGQHRESADPSLVHAVARWPRAVHVFDYDLGGGHLGVGTRRLRRAGPRSAARRSTRAGVRGTGRQVTPGCDHVDVAAGPGRWRPP